MTVIHARLQKQTFFGAAGQVLNALLQLHQGSLGRFDLDERRETCTRDLPHTYLSKSEARAGYVQYQVEDAQCFYMREVALKRIDPLEAWLQ